MQYSKRRWRISRNFKVHRQYGPHAARTHETAPKNSSVDCAGAHSHHPLAIGHGLIGLEQRLSHVFTHRAHNEEEYFFSATPRTADQSQPQRNHKPLLNLTEITSERGPCDVSYRCLKHRLTASANDCGIVMGTELSCREMCAKIVGDPFW